MRTEIHKLVEGSYLEEHMQEGWSLASKEPIFQDVHVVGPAPMVCGSPDSYAASVDSTFKLRKAFFLVGKTEEVDWEKKHHELAEELADRTKQKEAFEGEVERLKKAQEQLEKDLMSLRIQKDEAQSRSLAREVKLNKIVKHLGEAKVATILAAAE